MTQEVKRAAARAGTEKIRLSILSKDGFIRFMNIHGKDILFIQKHDTDPFCTIIAKDCTIETYSTYTEIVQQLRSETRKRLGFTDTANKHKFGFTDITNKYK